MSESHHFLVLTKRQASFVFAGLITFATASFIIGYIIGQRKAVADFFDQVEEDSFEDKVKYSMYSSYKSLAPIEIDPDPELDLTEPSEEHKTPATIKENKPAAVSVTKSAEVSPTADVSKKYYAQLYGCGNMNVAKKFVDRVRRLGFDTEIKARKSKNSKGKVITWYQVVTKPYEDKAKLLNAVEKIQLSEKLQKIKIVEE